MGTQDPLVHIEAATLAGGDNNQDRYAYGDGWAFVLDGASSFSETQPVHDGGWYAERLKAALTEGLTAGRRATTDIVAQAISNACGTYDGSTQGLCPTSTIALTRWDADGIELYVLGDSCAAAVTSTGENAVVLEDSRIDRFGASLRLAYQSRLRDGHGFDEEHRRLLAALQAAQKDACNRPGGYWIAGDDPRASAEAKIKFLERSDKCVILLSTDGIRAEDRGELMDVTRSMEEVLRKVSDLETRDSLGQEYPRSKLHDDKTAVRIRLEEL